ncbi:tetratricopeptide repeat protein [Haliangium sp.]|uniref:tetratricopeptide repeat protein n=1 Tax=Haliangium sp. TaxID=2663208 RepID=UPI003D13F110
MRRYYRWISVGVWLGLMASSPAVVHAQRSGSGQQSESGQDDVKAKARALWLRGDKLFAQGRYEEALEAFVESYRLSGRPRILVSMANTYERMGRYEQALSALRRYAPDAREDEQENIDARIRGLEQRAEKEREARWVEPAPAPASTSGPKAGSAPGAREDRTRERPLVGWVLVGSGAVGLGAGMSFGVLARGAKDDAGSLCQGAGDGSTLCLPEAESSFNRNRLYSRLADVSFAVGAVALATGAAVLLLGGDDVAGPVERPLVTVGPGTVEVSIVGRF